MVKGAKVTTKSQEERKYTIAQLRGAYGAGWHAGKKATDESPIGDVDTEWQQAMERIAECVERRHSESGESIGFIASAAIEAIGFGTRHYWSEMIDPLTKIILELQWGNADKTMTLREFLEKFEFCFLEGISRTEEPIHGVFAEKMLHMMALLLKEAIIKEEKSRRKKRLADKMIGDAS